MAFYTKHSQLITPSTSLIGIDTQILAIKWIIYSNSPLHKKVIYVIKKIDTFFWE